MGTSLLLHSDRSFRQYLPPGAQIGNYNNDILHEGRISTRRLSYYKFTFCSSISLANNTKTVGFESQFWGRHVPCIMQCRTMKRCLTILLRQICNICESDSMLQRKEYRKLSGWGAGGHFPFDNSSHRTNAANDIKLYVKDHKNS